MFKPIKTIREFADRNIFYTGPNTCFVYIRDTCLFFHDFTNNVVRAYDILILPFSRAIDCKLFMNCLEHRG